MIAADAPRGDWRVPVVAAVATACVASIGGALTELGPWYEALRKPSFQPPGWAFPVGWAAIFTLTAIAAVFCWRAARGPADRTAVVAAFAVNGALNILWSGLFFTLRRPDWALIEVAFLWLSIVALIVLAARLDRRAAWLLSPYLLWVSFASALNWAVVDLNGPFG